MQSGATEVVHDCAAVQRLTAVRACEDSEVNSDSDKPHLCGQVVFCAGHPGGKLGPQKAGGPNSSQTCTQTWKAACSKASCSQLVPACH